jgi:hypothetical protein
VLFAGITAGTVVKVVIAAVAARYMLKFGIGMLRGMGQPLPEPPPPGEMRKVNLRYRCSVCGVELKMTRANDEEPVAPRHCMEDMDLLAPVD